MEADWEIEIGGDAPVIEASWSGFVDLRKYPERARDLPEAAQSPALAEALIQLNSKDSLVWTAKCDIWPVEEPEALDAYELNADTEIRHALGCYIDILPKSGPPWETSTQAIAGAKDLCNILRQITLPCCRADLIIRRAWLTPEVEASGITAYLTACGKTAELAEQTLEVSLGAFVDAVRNQSKLK